MKVIASSCRAPFWDARILAVLLVGWLIQLTITKQMDGDDVQFSQFAQAYDLIPYLKERYLTWSSRVPIDAAMHLVINHMWLWRVLNFLAVVLLTFSIARLTWRQGGNFQRQFFSVFTLILAIPFSVSHSSAWWVTGSFNYLWPSALAAFSFVPFKLISEGRKAGFVLCVLAVLAGAFASFNEQIILFELCFYVALCLVYKREIVKNHKTLVFGVFVYLLVLVFILLSPGNQLRSVSETVNWYPDFVTLSFIDKAYLGISLSLSNFWRVGNWLSIVFCMLVFFIVLLRKYDNVTLSYSSIPLLFFVLGIFSSIVAEPGLTHLDDLYASLADFSAVEVNKLIYPEKLLPFSLGAFMSLSLAYLAYITISSRLDGKALLVVALIAASFASAAMMGLSPTMYASGERVYLVPNYFIVVAAGLLLAELETFGSARLNRIVQHGAWVLFVVCSLQVLYR